MMQYWFPIDSTESEMFVLGNAPSCCITMHQAGIMHCSIHMTANYSLGLELVIPVVEHTHFQLVTQQQICGLSV